MSPGNARNGAKFPRPSGVDRKDSIPSRAKADLLARGDLMEPRRVDLNVGIGGIERNLDPPRRSEAVDPLHRPLQGCPIEWNDRHLVGTHEQLCGAVA